MTVAVNTEVGRGLMTIDIAGWATVAGCMKSLPNPEGVPLAILRAFLYVKTPSAAAATLSIGVTTVGATATDVTNAIALNQTAGTLWCLLAQDIAAKGAWTTPALWAADTFLTFVTAAYVSTAFRGTLFIEYLRLT